MTAQSYHLTSTVQHLLLANFLVGYLYLHYLCLYPSPLENVSSVMVGILSL